MSFGIYNIKRAMCSNQIKKQINEYIIKNKKFITQYRMREILDKEKRALSNIRLFSGIDIPDTVGTVKSLLCLIDDNNGICEMDGCINEKSRDSGRWVLRKFCSRKCADRDFALKQSGLGNSFHKISEESRKSMGEKISEKINKKILKGEFTPNITNSWLNSKISVNINGKLKFVRSSWEAYFYILNPELSYKLIRIPYLDKKTKKPRNYITDFCDFTNKIIYEIKPKTKIKDNPEKIESAKEWCSLNFYSYVIITQDWIIERYNKKLLENQPEGERISMLIEKMIKYEN
jgi:hypothetical protein